MNLYELTVIIVVFNFLFINFSWETAQANGSARSRRSLSRRQDNSGRRLLSPIHLLQSTQDDSTIAVTNLLCKKLELNDSHDQPSTVGGSGGLRDQFISRKVFNPVADSIADCGSGGDGGDHISQDLAPNPPGKGDVILALG